MNEVKRTQIPDSRASLVKFKAISFKKNNGNDGLCDTDKI